MVIPRGAASRVRNETSSLSRPTATGSRRLKACAWSLLRNALDYDLCYSSFFCLPSCPHPTGVLHYLQRPGYPAGIRTPWIAVTGGMCYSFYTHAHADYQRCLQTHKRFVFASSLSLSFLIQTVLLGAAIGVFCTAYFVLIERPCMDPTGRGFCCARTKNPPLCLPTSRRAEFVLWRVNSLIRWQSLNRPVRLTFITDCRSAAVTLVPLPSFGFIERRNPSRFLLLLHDLHFDQRFT